ncbi:MAG TPA: hypothetical protein PLW78_12780 [bacterium]|nr:hypothetical protein [bacterium]HPG35636.1 hypothetical protein [bacterium]HPM47712.1 hypothetical protein [bacterium]HPV21676.1 hypothetical protein [bacterium]HRQ71166.1 hypothetical protein [bacterium]
MNKKWFKSAAVTGSGFEHLADETIGFSEISNEKLRGVDLLFVKNKRDFFSKFRFNGSTVISDMAINSEDQEKFILMSPGDLFISRIGHDIVNIFSPFEHFEYLEENMITDRVNQGIKFGRQINIIGHLVQNTKKWSESRYDFENFILTVQGLCRKSGIEIKIQNPHKYRIDTIPDADIMNPVIDEIVSNLKMHGSREFELAVVSNTEMVFRNDFDCSFNFERPKALLRCPFTKRTNSPGSGLGLFIFSLSSVRGGFDWDISVKENQFCLSLFF